MPSTSALMALGWSPAGLNSDLILNFPDDIYRKTIPRLCRKEKPTEEKPLLRRCEKPTFNLRLGMTVRSTVLQARKSPYTKPNPSTRLASCFFGVSLHGSEH